MSVTATDAMIEQINRYFAAVKTQTNPAKILHIETFDEKKGTSWKWDLKRYIRNYQDYDFLTSRIGIYYSPSGGKWSPGEGVRFNYNVSEDGILNVTKLTTQPWNALATGPVSRYRSSMVSIDGKIYMHGGRTYGGTYYNDTWEYDPENNTWVQLANGSGNRAFATYGAIDGKMYVYGGYSGGTTLNTTYAFDPPANAWARVADGPSARMESMGCVIDGKMYVVGGRNGNTILNTAYTYDPVTNSWTSIASCPVPVCRAAIGSINGLLYVFGGYTASGKPLLNDTYVYDPTTNNWKQLSDGPTGLCSMRAESVNNKLYVYGGSNNVNMVGVVSTMFVYDPTTDQWQQQISNSVKISEYASAVVNNKIYYFGGRTGSSSYINSLYSYDTSLDISAPYQLYIYWPAKKFTNGLVIPDIVFNGEVAGSAFVTMQQLNDLSGITNGNVTNINENWLKFTIDNIPTYVAKKPIRFNVSYNDLFSGNVVNGTRLLSIDNSVFKLRLLRSAPKPDSLSFSGYDLPEVINSEWNQLMYRVHSSVFTDPENTMVSEGQAASSLAQYTDSDLGLGYPVTGGDSWTQKNNMPGARNEYCGDVINGKYYVYGGAINNIVTNTLYVYDPTTDQWQQLTNGPAARSRATATTINNKLYVYGGVAKTGGSTTNTLFVYDPATNQWQQLANGLAARANHVAGNIAGKLYVYSGNYSSALYCYDPLTNTWQQLANGPAGRSGAYSSVINNKLYVYGGTNGESNYNTLFAYDPLTNYWTRLLDGPGPRRNGGCSVVGKDLYIFGGSKSIYESNYTKEIWRYDTVNNKWSRLNDSSQYYYGENPVCPAIGNLIYLCGSVTDANVYLNSVYQYTPVFTIYPNGAGNHTYPLLNNGQVVNRGISGVSYATTIDVNENNNAYGWRPCLEYVDDVGNISFIGEVNGTDFISMTDLIQQVGVSGDEINLGAPWLKFMVDGQIIYVAKKPILSNISYSALNSKGVLDGTKQLTIGNVKFQVDVLKGVYPGYTGAIVEGYDTNPTKSSEWNRLMYRIHSADFNDVNNTMASEGIAAGSLAQYTDDDLGLGYPIDVIGDTWQQLVNGTVPRYNAYASVIGGILYVYGGTDGTTIYNSLTAYNPASNTWTTLADGPGARHNGRAGAINGKLYIYGGTDGTNILSELHVYDPTANSWSSLTSGTVPVEGCSSAVLNNKLYVYGGDNGEASVSGLYQYDPSNDTWTTLTASTVPATKATMSAINNKLYVYGGLDMTGNTTYSSLRIYDPSNDTWSDGANGPSSRCAHSSVAINNKLYVYGGGGLTNSQLVAKYQDTYVYDPITNIWTQLSDGPNINWKHVAVNIGGRMYIFGGENNGTVYNTTYSYDTTTTTEYPIGSSDISGIINSDVILRGLKGVSYINKTTLTDINEYLGWRPVLRTNVIRTFIR